MKRWRLRTGCRTCLLSGCGRDERLLVRICPEDDERELVPTDSELYDVDGADVGGLQGGLQDGVGRE
jgi:hypothetical protein